MRRAKIATFMVTEYQREVAKDVWDVADPDKPSVTQLANKWLSDNPNFQPVETPRLESRLIESRNQGRERGFLMTLTLLYTDITEESTDARHTWPQNPAPAPQTEGTPVTVPGLTGKFTSTSDLRSALERAGFPASIIPAPSAQNVGANAVPDRGNAGR